jgi:hypothetical protein
VSPLPGLENLFHFAIFPRLRRGLHDRARSAGFEEIADWRLVIADL